MKWGVKALVIALMVVGAPTLQANTFSRVEGLDLSQLDTHMSRHSRMFSAFHAAPFGIGIDVSYADEEALEEIEAFIAQDDAWDVEAVTGRHPFELVRDYSGPSGIGLRGGGAVPGTAFRYMTLKREGASDTELEIARRDVVRAIETLHVVTVITGEPGRVARGVQRLEPENPDDPPLPFGDRREPLPLADEEGRPLPLVKNNGAPRADNSGGLLPEGHWSWEDSCSKDQLIGWLMAMVTLYDAARDDPDIDQALVRRMEDDARAIGAMLREKQTFTTILGDEEEYDLIIMDADGRPTYHHDLNPFILEGLYFPQGKQQFNTFNLFMAVGALRALLHVSGCPELEEFFYDELMERRGYLEMMAGTRGTGIDYLFVNEETNFSNVNMIAIALFLAIYTESDPQVLAVLRQHMEERFWNVPDTRQSARNLKQPYFMALYTAMTERGTDLEVVAEAANLLMEWPLAPYLATERINCDEEEIEAGSCLAIDGETTLELSPAPGRGGHVVALAPLPPRIRPASNFDARSDPFRVNGGDGGQRMMPGGDLLAAYWLLRYLEPLAPGDAAGSPFVRAREPHEPQPADESPRDVIQDVAEEQDSDDFDALKPPDEISPDAFPGDDSDQRSASGGCQAAGASSNLPWLFLVILLLLLRRVGQTDPGSPREPLSTHIRQ